LFLDFLLLDSFDQRQSFSVVMQHECLLAGLHCGSLSREIAPGKASQMVSTL
jgi:hypothetical protein